MHWLLILASNPLGLSLHVTWMILDLSSIDWGLMPSSHDNNQPRRPRINLISVNVSLAKMTAQAKGICLTLRTHHPYPLPKIVQQTVFILAWCSAYSFFCVLAHQVDHPVARNALNPPQVFVCTWPSSWMSLSGSTSRKCRLLGFAPWPRKWRH